jgi:hypothetical protein
MCSFLDVVACWHPSMRSASGVWVAERQQYEGTMVEIGASRAFSWRVSQYGMLTGVWDAFNRTFEEHANLPENATRGYAWEARRERNGIEPLPDALSAAHLGVDHLCALLIAMDSGMRSSRGDVADAEEQADAAVSAEAQGMSAGPGDGWHAPALATGYGAGFFEAPSFPQICRNETENQTRGDGSTYLNVTTICSDAPGEYDESGFYRRAPAQQRYAWLRDKLATEDSGNGTSTVVTPLSVGERYIFRVAAVYAGVVPLMGVEPTTTSTEGTVGGTDVSLSPTTQPVTVSSSPADASTRVIGPYSAYSLRVLIQTSGPGAPIKLDVDDVMPNSLRLSWDAPPFDPRSGVWHSDGGLPLIGYRILMRDGNTPAANATLVASTTETSYTLTSLPPQTLFRLQIVAENTRRRGLYSSTLSVATSALRATLWSDCNYASLIHQQLAYQGCFRDVDRPLTASDMKPATHLHRPDVPLNETYSWQMSAELCSSACRHTLYFGLRSGGYCLCGDQFGRCASPVSLPQCPHPRIGKVTMWS